MITLETPDARYRDSFWAAVKECSVHQDEDIAGFWRNIAQTRPERTADFTAFAADRADVYAGRNARIWGCPCAELWLIEDGRRFVGGVDIRYSLLPGQAFKAGHIGYFIIPSAQGRGYAFQGLKLALGYAAGVGIEPARICCHASNYASRRVIEKALAEFGGERLPDYREDEKTFHCYDLHCSCR